MSEETAQPSIEKNKNPIRPDPMFKDVTRKAALANGLELLDIELPQMLLADLILSVPQGIDLSDTLFDFVAPYSILEFKSENDIFDEYEFARNLARTFLFYSESKQVKYSQILTVFVCSQQPDRVIDHLVAEGTPVRGDPTMPWLLRCKVWSLNIAIIVCRLLPLEKRYYDWLLFAPADSVKWREFVKMLIRTGDRNMIEQIKKLRLKEFKLMSFDIAEELKGLSPQEQEERKRDWMELIETEFNMLEKWDPEMAGEVVSNLLAGLTPEQRKKLIELLSQLNDQPVSESQTPTAEEEI